MKHTTKNTINLSNSIIGVSLLAMPLCFKQCGIILSLFLVFLSFSVNRFSCYLLLKSAIVNRRRNYEVLAFDVFGVTGKRIVEISVLLFLLGTCIAFFVVLGDISSSLVAQFFDIPNSPHVRTLIVTFLAMFAILPLGLLPNVEALTSFSLVSLFVYILLGTTMFTIFVFKHFISDPPVVVPSAGADKAPVSMNSISYWNGENVVSYLPIFSMALSCQSQLFEIFQLQLYQAERGSLKLMMYATNRALKICSGVYIFMGIFGYLAFNDLELSGNILQMLPSGLFTKFTLLLFMITILTSFPLCLFPSRTSFHSLIFRKAGYHDLKNLPHTLRMTDAEFKCITIGLIVSTLGISILFPHVELILALVGSTIGTLICFILPGMIFAKLSDKNTLEYFMSFVLIFFGIIILIFCTFSAVHKISTAREMEIETKIKEFKKETAVSSNVSHVEESFSKTEFKAKIRNITKLKESIQKDLNTFQKNEDEALLHKLEKQQKEQSKIIEEQAKIIKELSSNVKHLKEDNVILPIKSEALESAVNASISVKIVVPQAQTQSKDAPPLSENSGPSPLKEPVPNDDAPAKLIKQSSVVHVSEKTDNASPTAVTGNVAENNPNANMLSKHKQLPISVSKLSDRNAIEKEQFLQDRKLKDDPLQSNIRLRSGEINHRNNVHSNKVIPSSVSSVVLSQSSQASSSSSSSSSVRPLSASVSSVRSAGASASQQSSTSRSVQQSETNIKQTNNVRSAKAKKNLDRILGQFQRQEQRQQQFKQPFEQAKQSEHDSSL